MSTVTPTKRIWPIGDMAAALLALAGLVALPPANETIAAENEDTTDVIRSPFGIGSCYTNNRSAEGNARWIPQMTAIGLRSHRCANTGWEAVEPEPEKWTWDVLDKQLKYLEGQRIAFGGILIGNPKWNQPMGLLDAKGKPRPAHTAMAQMIHYFGQRPKYLGWLLWNDKHYGFVFQGARNTVLATWASSLKPATIDFGQVVRIVDPLTGKVTEAATHDLTIAPILIDGVPDKLVKQAKANKDKPFPWVGDYTNAKSVSVTFGEKNVEKGLHTQSAETIARDVVAYGGSARSGGVPGGNVFMVDPNFLSYTSTPIEISIIVRRNEANDNAGFKLVYESTRGYKDLGWYTVPDNTKWHTVKWTIRDAQFVSMWGYNFLLNSDGNKYNKYYIQTVTVTKRDQK